MDTNPHHDAELWRRLANAARFAVAIHARQTRKGSGIPYIAHLLGVASLVLDHGGDEGQAIAGLLHDAIEDAGVEQEAVIAARFGPRVAVIVRACTDADTLPKPPWRARKEAYIAHLESAVADALLVSAADKLHNARAIRADLRTHGAAVYDRFTSGRDGTLWHYRALSEAFRGLLPGPLSAELAHTVEDMRRLSAHAPPPNGTGPSCRHDDPRERKAAFNAVLADSCGKLAASSHDRLADEVRAMARDRPPLLSGIGDAEAKTFWDEFAWVIVDDRMALREGYDDALRKLCRLVVGRMPALEREVLSQHTDAYREMWRPDEPGPSEGEKLAGLVEEVFRRTCLEADDHGWQLKDAEDIDDKSSDEVEA